MNPTALLNAMPGAISQGLIWGIMAIGVYLTYKILDVADLTVDGTLCTGGATFIMATMAGCSIPVALLLAFIAGLVAGLVTGILHVACGIPAVLAGILTQLALYSVNLRIMGKSNQPINANNYDLLISSRNVKVLGFENPIFIVGLCVVLLIALLYWFFGTELGSSLRATGSNAKCATLVGVNTSKIKISVYAISGFMSALAGLIMISREYYTYFIEKGACPERFIRMAKALGMEDAKEPMDFVRVLVKLQEDCGVADLKMSDYGMKKADCMTLALNDKSTMPVLFTVDPLPMSDEDCAAIFEKSFR